MSKKIFVDANVILDFLDKKRPRHEMAKEAFSLLISNFTQIITSEDIITTVYYISKEKLKVLDFFENFYKFGNIITFGEKNIKESITQCKKNSKIDFEDMLQVLSAINNNCKILLTNDINFPKINGIEVINIKEFIQKFSKDREGFFIRI